MPVGINTNTKAQSDKATESHLHEENALSREVISAAIEVHRTIGGPGLLECAYEEALVEELTLRGLPVVRQLRVPIIYKGKTLATTLTLDLLISDKLIIECKAVEKHNPLYEAQLLTYLRLTNRKLGLLINFGERLVKNGIHRVIN